MADTIIIVGIVIASVVLAFVCKYDKDKEEEEARARRTARKEAESATPPKQDVESDILYALRELNCCPEYVSKEDNGTTHYKFQYQGGFYVLLISDKCHTVDVVDLCWYNIHKEDVDRYSDCRRIINEMNISYIGYTIYYEEVEENQISLCTTNSIFVSRNHEQLVKDLTQFMRVYFTIHHEFFYRMMRAGQK